MRQLEDNLAASDVKLTAQEVAKLDQVSALPPEYPGWMIEFQGARIARESGERSESR